MNIIGDISTLFNDNSNNVTTLVPNAVWKLVLGKNNNNYKNLNNKIPSATYITEQDLQRGLVNCT